MNGRFSSDFWSRSDRPPVSRDRGATDGSTPHPSPTGRGAGGERWTGIERFSLQPGATTPAEHREGETYPRDWSVAAPFGDVCAAGLGSRSAISARRPSCVYVPEKYEPNYPYPLIVWFHGVGGDERALMSILPTISDRNYLGLSLRGTSPANLSPGEYTGGREGEDTGIRPGGYRWAASAQTMAQFEVDLYEAVRALRREYHVHSERVYLAGFDEGATTALELMLRRPDWFGGAICLAGRFPTSEHSLARFRDLRGKPVLIAGGAQDGVSPPSAVVQAGRLLHAAGMLVSTRIVEGGHEISRTMLRQIDYWLMDAICAAT